MVAVRTAAALALVLQLACCAWPGIGWQGRGSPELDDYLAAFAREAGSRIDGTATIDEVVALALRCRALWLGDTHSCAELHQRQRDLLQHLCDAGVPLCLGVEALGLQDQSALDAFLQGRIGIGELAARVRARWPGSWLDADDVDAAHYRELLQFARATATPAFALEPTPRLPLDRRDAAIAARVRIAATLHPERLIVVVVGQAHLLGLGRLPQRTALSSLLLGAEPGPQLRQSVQLPPPPPDFVRSDGGLWFFADLVAGRP